MTADPCMRDGAARSHACAKAPVDKEDGIITQFVCRPQTGNPRETEGRPDAIA